MKRRQRKPVLDLNGETDSPRRKWQGDYSYQQYRENSPSNPLSNIVGQYDSDDESESKPKTNKLNDQVNDFFAEIQSITPKMPNPQHQNSSSGSLSEWQECFDESTGYPYYWHTKTNEVTWEMPLELKMLKNKKDDNEEKSRSSKPPQWSHLATQYSDNQNNIPDGMIPKEVVARNRNRQAGISQQRKSSETPPLKKHHSKYPGSKDISIDDGKIEMITSFGDDESESEESDHEIQNHKQSKITCHSESKSHERINLSKKSDEKQMFGPTLPPSAYGPTNNSTYKKPSTSSNKQNDGDTGASKHKHYSSASNAATKIDNFNQKTKDSFGKKLKLSLVPGYEDDSEGDEDSPRKHATKPLFPISDQYQQNYKSENKEKELNQLSTASGSIRIYDYRNDTKTDIKDEDSSEIESNDKSNLSKDETNYEQDNKANKFLDEIDASSKVFQRKRRIAFDVVQAKTKNQESPEMNYTKDEITGENSECSTDVDRQGALLGDNEETNSKVLKDSEPKSTSGFVKGEILDAKDDEVKVKKMSEEEKLELNNLTESIMEKLKFLSEGSPAVSAVQVMGIQLQTLICAWEAKELNEHYLQNWLKNTSCELSKLEQTAAPQGWECQWDRTHKRYYYRNSSTGEAQWTYPQPDIAGGAEEMELCTTPPPPEHIEPPIIEMNSQSNNTEIKDQSQESNKVSERDSIPVPPPPVISSPPSPPPPPRINADDLRDNYEKNNIEKTLALKDSLVKDTVPLSQKEVEESNSVPKPVESIPPAVDPPEIAYALPGPAFEALYGHQQINPIYAATLGGAGIPLLPHHALSQLMHYPAYHQHLHNQALVARFSGQDAMQFMIPEYAAMYENSQVIAKPPVKVTQESSLGSALNSFYSDIASIEKSSLDFDNKDKNIQQLAQPAVTAATTPALPSDAESSSVDTLNKEKKKKKIKTGLGKKQKEMSSMVAKWQKAQKNYKDG